jgi:hypothetical protein
MFFVDVVFISIQATIYFYFATSVWCYIPIQTWIQAYLVYQGTHALLALGSITIMDTPSCYNKYSNTLRVIGGISNLTLLIYGFNMYMSSKNNCGNIEETTNLNTLMCWLLVVSIFKFAYFMNMFCAYLMYS